MQFKDYYKTLKIPRNASQEEIKRAYRKLARKYHPDVSREANAEEKFKEIGEAYEVLKDPEKRAAYDQFGDHWKEGQGFTPPPNWDAGFEFSGGGFTGSDSRGFSDFFENLFGNAGRGNKSWRFETAGFGAHGGDRHAKILISLEDAYQGTTQSILLTLPETDAHGYLHNRKRTLNVKIPRGIKEGQRIRLAGQGSPGIGNAPPGDLFLEIRYKPHPYFRAEGRDIYLTLPLTPWEAALGTKIAIPTLGGRIDLRIPPGSQTGQKLRLKGRGLPGVEAGDQFVILKIVTPPATSPEAQDFYRKMSKTMPFNPRTDFPEVD